MSVDVVLRCPTCRHDWPLARCAHCGDLFDPGLNYDGQSIRTRPGRRRAYCSRRCNRAAEYRREVLRGVAHRFEEVA